MKLRLALVIAFIAACAVGGVWWESTAARRNAGRIIAAIEEYRGIHGRLPGSENHQVMKSLGFELRAGWHPDYEIQDKEYRITILEGFDGPYWTYHSLTRTWTRAFPSAK